MDVMLQNYMASPAMIFVLTVVASKKKERTHFTMSPPDYFIFMLDKWRKDNTNICYLAEATLDNSDYINGLLRMRVVDNIFYISYLLY